MLCSDARVTPVRRRIALLLDSFDAPYQAALVRFARQACERRGLSLVVFPGGVPGGAAFAARQRNRIYDLISGVRFDAVVVLAGTMTREAGVDVLREFCRRFQPLPMCSIGSRLEGIPSYLVDNLTGMRSLARHLVEDHGYRQLAFIGGPSTNEEANERLLAFRDELRGHGIELSPADIVHGDFMSASGQAALRVLLQDRARRPQAIVAANDAMAMGVLEALTHYPPEQARPTAVCGFDNVIESDFCSPPLTTVEQPLQRLAEGAIESLVAQMSGVPCDQVRRYEARPVFRRSCGCDAAQAAAPAIQRQMANRGNSVLEFLRHKADILAQLSSASAGTYDALPRWDERLLESFIDHVRGVPGAAFLARVSEQLQHTMREHHGETWRFHNVLSALRRHCLPCVAGDPIQWTRAEDVLQTARTLAGEAVLRGQARRLLAADRQSLVTNNLGTLLGEARDAGELSEALRRGLQELGIGKLMGVAFLSSALSCNGSSQASARAFFVSGAPGGAGRAEALGDVFEPRRLVPSDTWLEGDTASWVALPLFYRHEPLGYLLAELSLDDGGAYESLRVHVSASLWALRQAPSSSPASA